MCIFISQPLYSVRFTLSYLFIYFWLCWLFVAHRLSLLVMCGFLVAVTSLVTEHGL